MNVEHISWIDAHSVDEWCFLDRLDVENPVILSVGLVTRETEHTVVLSLGYNRHERDVCSSLVIPKCTILKRKVILRNAEKI